MNPARKTYVLVHGAYHGGWCWKDVARRLRGLGHDVYTPTLTGLGERAHLIAISPTLEMFITDVAQVIAYEDLQDVVLVGHSFAGSVVAGVADRMPERLQHLVFFDAQVLQSGESAFDRALPEVVGSYRAAARASSGGLSVPAGDPARFGIADPGTLDWIKTKLTPQPYQTYRDKLQLTHPLRNGVPATYIACTAPMNPPTASSRERVKAMPGWTYLELAAGHDAMLTAPAELTAMLAGIGRAEGCRILPSTQAAQELRS